MDVILDVNFRSSCRSARAFLLQPRGGWLLRSAWHNNENSDTENMSIFHCAHSKGLEFSAICLDVTVDVITSRSRAICMDVSLDVNFRGPALQQGSKCHRVHRVWYPVELSVQPCGFSFSCSTEFILGNG